MARKRLRHTRNCSENVRNSILYKRATSLFKKAEEFSILCDVDVAIIIFRSGETEPLVWKSISLAREVLMRYLSVTDNDRSTKLIKLETYLSIKVNKKEEEIRKIEKLNEEKEMELLFNQFMEGRNINEFDSRQIKGLLKLFPAKMAKLNETNKQVNHPLNPPSYFKLVNQSFTPAANSMENSISDPWFVDTMATHQNDFCLWGGSNTEPAPMEGDDTNAEDDGHSKDVD
ncbi:hypothetical protein RND71_037081 [Anisodus tanguticus]|uniref:MADS-box domain-containing protein n=1 Tax=Anisodus tanguticus TaxID=243964 RepID=A0AAE1UUQ8_9SOLA|nr:hypothetical protein RND71_037081 [Anisodus tanguticus]